MNVSGLRAALAAALLVLPLVACSGDDGGDKESAPEPQPLRELLADETSEERDERCGSIYQDNSGCYPVEVFGLYCAVQDMRRHFAAGEFTLDQMPKWANRTLREDGTPQIYDFRDPVKIRKTDDPRRPVHRKSDLWSWMQKRELRQIHSCAHTQTKIERTEGGLFRNYDPDAMYVDRSE